LHTRNRPKFLMRAISYYNEKFRYPLFILDQSDDNYFEEITSSLSNIKLNFPLEILHHDVAIPMYQRFSDALRKVSSPYVLPMADTSLYYEPWIDESIKYLEGHPSCGTVYGHTISFELDSYAPFGDIKRLSIGEANPVARWMEHESPIERLGELGMGPWTTTGWYAAQRTEILKKIVSEAQAAQLNTDVMFERLITILQPIYGKVVMLDSQYLARQVKPPEYNLELNSYRVNKRELASLTKIATDALSQVCSIEKRQSKLIIRKAFQPELNKLKLNDFRNSIKVYYWKSKLTYLNQFIRFFKVSYNKLSQLDPLAPDPRLPAKPAVSPAWKEILTRWTHVKKQHALKAAVGEDLQ
jgi:glycosyltransferase domain-containing protein